MAHDQTVVRECEAKTLCLGQHSAPQGAHTLDCLNVSSLWRGGCWVDKETKRKLGYFFVLYVKYIVAFTKLKKYILLCLDVLLQKLTLAVPF